MIMLFDMKCQNCDNVKLDVYLPFEHDDTDHPQCCRMPMRKYHLTMGLVHWRDPALQDGGFIAHSMPGAPVITSTKQNRELMKRHNLLDANEVYSGKTPTKAEQMAEHQKSLDSIAAVTPTAQEADMLKSAGITDNEGNLNQGI